MSGFNLNIRHPSGCSGWGGGHGFKEARSPLPTSQLPRRRGAEEIDGKAERAAWGAGQIRFARAERLRSPQTGLSGRSRPSLSA